MQFRDHERLFKVIQIKESYLKNYTIMKDKKQKKSKSNLKLCKKNKTTYAHMDNQTAKLSYAKNIQG